MAIAGDGFDTDSRTAMKSRDGSRETESLADALRGVRDDAVAAGADIGRTAKHEAMAAVDRGRDTLASRLGNVVSAIETSATELRSSEPMLADASSAIAGRLRSVASHLHHQDARGLAQEASDLARNNPLAFLLGSVAIGFAAARMTRAATPSANTQDQS